MKPLYLLDSDLARLYGVTTKRLNQQVKRNQERFPVDFVFQLSADEGQALRSQIATSSAQTPDDEGMLRSQFATSSRQDPRLRLQIATLKPRRGRHRK